MTREAYFRNLELFNEDLKERRIVMRAMPIWLGMVLTTRCNLRCVMCGRVAKKGEVPSSVMEKTRPLYPYLSQMQWQGGEVFVVDYFREMFEEATRHPNIFHLIITSGVLIDAAWARRFAQSNVTLMFSIDTAVPEHYELIRKGARFERVLDTFHYLDEAEKTSSRKVVRSLNAAIMKENISDVPLLIPFAHKYRLLEVDITPRVPLDDDISIFARSNLDKNRTALEKLRIDLLQAHDQAKAAGIRLLDRVLPVIDGLLNPPVLAPSDGAAAQGTVRGSWDCFVPWRGLLVQAEYNNGDIMPDCNCFTTPVGNAGRDNLLEVWNNEKMQEYRRRILEKRVQGWCGSQCTQSLNPAEWYKPEMDFVNDRITGDPRILEKEER